jgi:glycosyltransferase involved in cell wall biosynthesis
METEPRVSIIVPAFNAAVYLEQTLDSVLTQTFTNWEMLVIDDGSTDLTWSIIERFANRDRRVKGFQQKNQGVSAARNFGFKNAVGECLAFLDADDIWLPDNLELKLHKFETGNFGLVHSDAAIINASGELTTGTLRGEEGNLLRAMLSWQRTQVPAPSGILVKHSAIRDIGLFDEALSTSADQDFFIRVASKYLIGRVPIVTWQYRLHENNMHKNISRMEHDVLLVFNKAKRGRLFQSWTFQQYCFGNMYSILAASWAGDGKNWKRGTQFGLRAILANPLLIFKFPIKIFNKWLKS